MGKRGASAQYAYGITVEVDKEYKAELKELENGLKDLDEKIKKTKDNLSSGIQNKGNKGFEQVQHQTADIVESVNRLLQLEKELGGVNAPKIFDGLQQNRDDIEKLSGSVKDIRENFASLNETVKSLPSDLFSRLSNLFVYDEKGATDKLKGTAESIKGVIKEISESTDKKKLGDLMGQLTQMVSEFQIGLSQATNNNFDVADLGLTKLLAELKNMMPEFSKTGAGLDGLASKIVGFYNTIGKQYKTAHPNSKLFDDIIVSTNKAQSSIDKTTNKIVTSFNAAINVVNKFKNSDMGLAKKSKEMEEFLAKLENPQVTIDLKDKDIITEFMKLEEEFDKIVGVNSVDESFVKNLPVDQLKKFGDILQNIKAMAVQYSDILSKDFGSNDIFEEEVDAYSSNLRTVVDEIKRQLLEVSELGKETAKDLKSILDGLNIQDIQINLAVPDESEIDRYTASLNEFIGKLAGNIEALKLPLAIVSPTISNSKEEKGAIADAKVSIKNEIDAFNKALMEHPENKDTIINQAVANITNSMIDGSGQFKLYLEFIKNQFAKIRNTISEQKKNIEQNLELDFKWKQQNFSDSFASLFNDIQQYFVDNPIKVEIDDSYLKDRIADVFKNAGGVDIQYTGGNTPIDSTQLAVAIVSAFKDILTSNGTLPSSSRTTPNRASTPRPIATSNIDVTPTDSSPKFVFNIQEFMAKHSGELSDSLSSTLSLIIKAVRDVSKRALGKRVNEQAKASLQSIFSANGLDILKANTMTDDDLTKWVQEHLLKADVSGTASGRDVVDMLNSSGVKGWGSVKKLSNSINQLFIKIEEEQKTAQEAITNIQSVEVLKDIGNRARTIQSKSKVLKSLKDGQIDADVINEQMAILQKVKEYKTEIGDEKYLPYLDKVIDIYKELLNIQNGSIAFTDEAEKQKQIEDARKRLYDIRTSEDSAYIAAFSGRIEKTRVQKNGSKILLKPETFSGGDRERGQVGLVKALNRFEDAQKNGYQVKVILESTPNDKGMSEWTTTENDSGTTVYRKKSAREDARTHRGESKSDITQSKKREVAVEYQEVDFKPFSTNQASISASAQSLEAYDDSLKNQLAENQALFEEQQKIVDDAKKKLEVEKNELASYNGVYGELIDMSTVKHIQDASNRKKEATTNNERVVNGRDYKDLERNEKNTISKNTKIINESESQINDFINGKNGYKTLLAQFGTKLNDALMDLDSLLKGSDTLENRKRIQSILEFIRNLQKQFNEFASVVKSVDDGFDIKFEDLAIDNLLSEYKQKKDAIQGEIDQIDKALDDVRKQKNSITVASETDKKIAEYQMKASEYYNLISSARSYAESAKRYQESNPTTSKKYSNKSKSLTKQGIAEGKDLASSLRNYIDEQVSALGKTNDEKEQAVIRSTIKQMEELLAQVRSVITGGDIPLISGISKERYNDIINSDKVYNELIDEENKLVAAREDAVARMSKLSETERGAMVLDRASRSGKTNAESARTINYLENTISGGEQRITDLKTERALLESEQEKLKDKKKYIALVAQEKQIKEEIVALDRQGLSTEEKSKELASVQNKIKKVQKKLNAQSIFDVGEKAETDSQKQFALQQAVIYDEQEKLVRNQLSILESKKEQRKSAIENIGLRGLNSAAGGVELNKFIQNLVSEFQSSQYYIDLQNNIRDKYLKDIYKEDGTVQQESVLTSEVSELVSEYKTKIYSTLIDATGATEEDINKFLISLRNDTAKYTNSEEIEKLKNPVQKKLAQEFSKSDIGGQFLADYAALKNTIWDQIHEEEQNIVKEYKDSINVDKHSGTIKYTSYATGEGIEVSENLKEKIIAKIQHEVDQIIEKAIVSKTALLGDIVDSKKQAMNYGDISYVDIKNADIHNKLSGTQSKITAKNGEIEKVNADIEAQENINYTRREDLLTQIAKKEEDILGKKEAQKRTQEIINSLIKAYEDGNDSEMDSDDIYQSIENKQEHLKSLKKEEEELTKEKGKLETQLAHTESLISTGELDEDDTKALNKLKVRKKLLEEEKVALEQEAEAWEFVEKARAENLELSKKSDQQKSEELSSKVEAIEGRIVEKKEKQAQLQAELTSLRGQEVKDIDAIDKKEEELAKTTKSIEDLQASKNKYTQKLDNVRERIVANNTATSGTSFSGGILSPIINLLSEIRDMLSKISGVSVKGGGNSKSNSNTNSGETTKSEINSMLSRYWQKKNGKSATKEEWAQLKKDYVAGKLTDLDEVLAKEVQKKVEKEKKDDSKPVTKKNNTTKSDDRLSNILRLAGFRDENNKAIQLASKSTDEFLSDAQALYNEVKNWSGDKTSDEYLAKQLRLGKTLTSLRGSLPKTYSGKNGYTTAEEWANYLSENGLSGAMESSIKNQKSLKAVIENGVSVVAEEVVTQGTKEGKKVAEETTSESTSKRKKYAGGLTWQQAKEKIKTGAESPKDDLSLDEYIAQAQSLYTQIDSYVGEKNIEYFSKRFELGNIMQKAAVAARKENPDKGFNNKDWYQYFAEQYNMPNVNDFALTSRKLGNNKAIMDALIDSKQDKNLQTESVNQVISDGAQQIVEAAADSAKESIDAATKSSEQNQSGLKDVSEMTKEEQEETRKVIQKILSEHREMIEKAATDAISNETDKSTSKSKSMDVSGRKKEADSNPVLEDEVKNSQQFKQLIIDITKAIERGENVSNKNIEYGYTERNGKKVEFVKGDSGIVHYNNLSENIDSMIHSHAYKKGVNNLMFSLQDITQMADLADENGLKQYAMMYGTQKIGIDLGKNTTDTAFQIAEKYPIINDVITAMFATADGNSVAAQNSDEMERVLNGYLQRAVEEAGGKLSITDAISGNDLNNTYSITDEEYGNLRNVVSGLKPYYDKIINGNINVSQQEYVDEIRSLLSKEFGKDFISSLVNREYDKSKGGIDAEYNAIPSQEEQQFRNLMAYLKSFSEGKKLTSYDKELYDQYKDVPLDQLVDMLGKLNDALGTTVDDSEQKSKTTLTKSQMDALNPDSNNALKKRTIKDAGKALNWDNNNYADIEKVLGEDDATLLEYKTKLQELQQIANDIRTNGENGTIITNEELQRLDKATEEVRALQTNLTKNAKIQSTYNQLEKEGRIVSGDSKISNDTLFTDRQAIMEAYAKQYATSKNSQYDFSQYDFVNDKISFDMIDADGKVTSVIMGWSDAFNSAYIQAEKLKNACDDTTDAIHKINQVIMDGQKEGFFNKNSQEMQAYQNAMTAYGKAQEAVRNSTADNLDDNIDKLTIAKDELLKLGNSVIGKVKSAYGYNKASDVLNREDYVNKTLESYQGQGANIEEIAAVKAYRDALDELKKKKDELAKQGKLSSNENGEQTALKLLADRAEEAEKALLAVDKAQREINSNQLTADDAKFFKDVNPNKINEIKNTMLNYVNSIEGASFKGFNEETRTMTYEMKVGKNEVQEMTIVMGELGNAVEVIPGKIKPVESGLQGFINGIKGKFKELGTYMLSFASFYRLWAEIKQGVSYVQEIDTALTELKKVTDETDATYNQFLKTMSKTGAEVGATTADLTNMAARWARLGYTIEEAGDLAKSTAVLLNVSEFTDADKASEALISTIQAYGYAAEDSMHVVDVLNEIGNNFAVSSDGIATALQDSASSLMAAGNSLEQSVAMIAAANKVLQDPNSVGSALRTISLRIRGTSVKELEELGEETDGAVESVSKLQAKVQGLSGVNILTDTGAYKSTYEIIKEIASVWKDMSDIDQAALLELLAGKNRSNAMAAMLTNLDDLTAAYDDAMEAQGSAEAENEKYLDSIKGKMEQFTNATQTMWTNALSSDIVKFFVDIGTNLVNIIDKLGLFQTLLAGIITYYSTLSKNKIDLASILGIHNLDKDFLSGFSAIGKQGLTGWVTKLFKRTKKNNITETILGDPKDVEVSVEDFAAAIQDNINDYVTIDTSEIDSAIENVQNKLMIAREQLEDTKTKDWYYYKNLNSLTPAKDRDNNIAAKTQEVENLEAKLTELQAKRDNIVSSAVNSVAESMVSPINNETQAYQSMLSVLSEVKDMKLSLGNEQDAAIKIDAMSAAAKDGQMSLANYVSSLGDADIALKAYAASVQDGNYSLAGFQNFIAQHNAGLQASGIAARAAAVGHQLLNAAISFGISLLISGAISLITKLVNAEKEAKQAAEDAINTYKQTQSTLKDQKATIDELSESYAKLSKGVDSAGNNISLTTDEYDRYNDICNQIADMFPSLVVGFNEQGAAILSCKGNVAELTKAYNDMIVAANNAVLVKGKDIFKGFKSSANDFNESNFKNTKMTYSTIKNLDKILESSDIDDAIDTYARTGTTSMVQIVQALKDKGLKQQSGETGHDFIKRSIQENKTIVQAIVGDFNAQVEAEVSKVKPIAEAYIGNAFLNGNYSNISSDMKAIVKSMVSQFDLDFYNQFENVDDMYAYLSNMLDKFSNLSKENKEAFKGLSDLQTQFNLGKISYKDYKNQLETFLNQLKSEFSEEELTQFKLSLGIDESSLDTDINHIKSLLGDKVDDIDSKINSLSVKDLQIAGEIPTTTLNSWDELLEKIKEIKAADIGDFNIADYSDSISSISENIGTLQDALDKLNSGSFTMRDYLSLIKDFPDLAKGVDVSSKSFKGLTSNIVRAIKASPKSLIKDLKALKLQLIGTGKSTSGIDQLIRSLENMPENALDSIINKYSTLADNISSATEAQNELKAAMEENPNEGFETRGEAMDYMKDLMSRGEIGSESNLWNVAEKYGFTYDSAKTINENADALAQFIAVREKWFKKDDDGNYTYEGTEEFIKNVGAAVASMPELQELMTWNYDENTGVLDFDFENKDWDQIVKYLSTCKGLIGLTSDEWADMLVQIGQYFNINWGNYNDELEYLKKIVSSDSDNKTKVEQYGSTMQDYFGKDSSIDLANRPMVSSSAMKAKGWDVEDGSYATVFSSAYSNEGETAAITVTPILPDGEVLTEDELTKYATEIVNGADPATYEFEVNGKTYTGEDIILAKHNGKNPAKEAEEYGKALHEAQEEYDKLRDTLNINTTIDEKGINGLSEIKEIQDAIGKNSDGTVIIDENAFRKALTSAEYTEDQIDVIIDKIKSLNSNAFNSDSFNIGKIIDQETGSGIDGLLEIKELQDAIKKDAKTGLTVFDTDMFTSVLSEAGYTKAQIDELIQKIQEYEGIVSVAGNTDPLGLNSANLSIDTLKASLSTLGIFYEDTLGDWFDGKRDLVINVPDLVSTLKEKGWSEEAIRNYCGQLSTANIEGFNIKVNDQELEEALAKSDEVPEEKTTNYEVTGNGATTLEGIDNTWDDVTQDKTTNYTINETTVKKTVEEDSEAGGTAVWYKPWTWFANGTAHAQGNWGADQTGTSLVGELGPELRVRGNRWEMLGENGAEFADVKKGDIIFNHKQTKQLLENGYINSRGKAYASGTAYADGGGTFNGYNFSGNGGYTKYDVNNNIVDSFGDATSNLSDAADDLSDTADDFEEVFDWFEVLIQEIDDDLNYMSAALENAIGISAKNDIQDQMINVNKYKLTELGEGYKLYADYAAQLLEKVPQQYQDLAKNGGVALTEFLGEANKEVVDAINNYREWAQKAADVRTQQQEVKKEITSISLQKVQTIADEYDRVITKITTMNDLIQANIDLIDEQGERTSAVMYEEMIKNSSKQLDELKKQRADMQKEFDAQVSSGNIEVGSEVWYEGISAIQDVDKSIIDCRKDIESFQNSINQLHWDNFDKLIDAIDNVGTELSNLGDLIDDDDAVDEMGNWTDKGITKMGLLAQEMERAQYRAQQYAEQIDYLNQEYAAGKYSTDEYNEKLQELKDGQWDSIKSYEAAKDAIVDLNKARVESAKNAIQKEIDAYSDLISKKKEELQLTKDAHDFSKQVAESQKNIANIEKQLAAISSDNSAAAVAKRKKLQAELAAAQEELDELYYSHNVEQQQDALDKNLEDYQDEKDKEMEKLDEYLKNVEQVIADSFATITGNTETVAETLKGIADEYGINLSEAITSPWEQGSIAIGTYQEQLDTSISAFTQQLEGIKQKLIDLQTEADKTAKSLVEATNQQAKDTSSATYTPPTPSSTPSTPSTPSKPSAPSVGSSVTVKKSATNFSRDGGNGTRMQSWVPGTTFTVYQTTGSEVLIGRNGGYTGWVRLSDIEGYRLGVNGVKKNQLAITDEDGLEELVLHAGVNGKLQYLSKGSSVIPSDITENLMELGQLDPRQVLERNMPKIGAPYIVNNNMEINMQIAEVVHIDHADSGSISDISKAVQKQMDSYMKNINSSLKRYTR